MQIASGLKKRFRRSKRWWRTMRGEEPRFRAASGGEKIALGNERAEWRVCPRGLSAESVAYSFGVGQDVSFDLELIRRFGMRVHAFDPTPRAIAWVKSQRLPERFVFHDFGVAEYDGTAAFHAPENGAHVSYSVLPRKTGAAETVEAPVHRLRTIQEMLGHARIDLVKMDIEGAEYGVVRDALSSGIEIEQLLVEFHHRWPEVGPQRTKDAVEDLLRAGYEIFDISASGEEYGFRKT